MYSFDETVPSDEDRRQPGVEIDQLRQLFSNVGGSTCNQIGVLHTIFLDECALAREALLLLRFLEVESDDG